MSALHFDESLVRIFNENALDTYSVEEELAGALCAGGRELTLRFRIARPSM